MFAPIAAAAVLQLMVLATQVVLHITAGTAGAHWVVSLQQLFLGLDNLLMRYP